jgi:drug/metabolite transporter (DMT)-like permease
MDWVPLTLLCAFSLASADALTKRHLGDCGGGEILTVRFGLAGVLLAPGLWLAPLPPVPPSFWLWMGALVPLEIVAMRLYVVAIRDSPLSRTLPYLAFTPVFTTLTGWILLGERVSLGGFAGVLLVFAGTWVLNAEGVPGAGLARGLEPFRAVLRERGARLMLTTAAIYSLTAVMSKAAMLQASPESFGAFYFVVIGAVTLVALPLAGRGGLGAVRRHPLASLAIAALSAAMVVTHFLALAQVEVAYMISVKRMSLIFGVLYGAWLFGERRLGRNLLASALMVAGVALILASH